VNVINVYTNMQDNQVREYHIDPATNIETEVDETVNQNNVNNEIITTKVTNKIYSITVDVFKHDESTSPTKYQTNSKLYTLTSNRE